MAQALVMLATPMRTSVTTSRRRIVPIHIVTWQVSRVAGHRARYQHTDGSNWLGDDSGTVFVVATGAPAVLEDVTVVDGIGIEGRV
jgi:hypothetical protein